MYGARKWTSPGRAAHDRAGARPVRQVEVVAAGRTSTMPEIGRDRRQPLAQLAHVGAHPDRTCARLRARRGRRSYAPSSRGAAHGSPMHDDRIDAPTRSPRRAAPAIEQPPSQNDLASTETRECTAARRRRSVPATSAVPRLDRRIAHRTFADTRQSTDRNSARACRQAREPVLRRSNARATSPPPPTTAVGFKARAHRCGSMRRSGSRGPPPRIGRPQNHDVRCTTVAVDVFRRLHIKPQPRRPSSASSASSIEPKASRRAPAHSGERRRNRVHGRRSTCAPQSAAMRPYRRLESASSTNASTSGGSDASAPAIVRFLIASQDDGRQTIAVLSCASVRSRLPGSPHRTGKGRRR